MTAPHLRLDGAASATCPSMDDLTPGALSPLLMAHTDIESDGSSYISYMIFVAAGWALATGLEVVLASALHFLCRKHDPE